MNSVDEIINNDNHSSDQGSLNEQIEELERWNEFLDNELIAYRRRLWQDFEVMVCMAHTLKRVSVPLLNLKDISVFPRCVKS